MKGKNLQKKKRWIIGFLLMIFITISGFSCSSQQWKKIKVKEGNFSILFPGKPTRRIENISTAAGNIKGYIYTYSDESDESDKKTTFLIMYSDFPEELMRTANAERVLESTVNGQIGSLKGRMISSKKIYLNDTYPGIEVEYKSNRITFLTRVYLKENRLFQILAGSSNITKDRNDIKKFLTSFKIIE